MPLDPKNAAMSAKRKKETAQPNPIWKENVAGMRRFRQYGGW
jgi:hypothetical protein